MKWCPDGGGVATPFCACFLDFYIFGWSRINVKRAATLKNWCLKTLQNKASDVTSHRFVKLWKSKNLGKGKIGIWAALVLLRGGLGDKVWQHNYIIKPAGFLTSTLCLRVDRCFETNLWIKQSSNMNQKSPPSKRDLKFVSFHVVVSGTDSVFSASCFDFWSMFVYDSIRLMESNHCWLYP